MALTHRIFVKFSVCPIIDAQDEHIVGNFRVHKNLIKLFKNLCSFRARRGSNVQYPHAECDNGTLSISIDCQFSTQPTETTILMLICRQILHFHHGHSNTQDKQ